jgi:hypothetical protein
MMHFIQAIPPTPLGLSPYISDTSFEMEYVRKPRDFPGGFFL